MGSKQNLLNKAAPLETFNFGLNWENGRAPKIRDFRGNLAGTEDKHISGKTNKQQQTPPFLKDLSRPYKNSEGLFLLVNR